MKIIHTYLSYSSFIKKVATFTFPNIFQKNTPHEKSLFLLKTACFRYFLFVFILIYYYIIITIIPEATFRKFSVSYGLSPFINTGNIFHFIYHLLQQFGIAEPSAIV